MRYGQIFGANHLQVSRDGDSLPAQGYLRPGDSLQLRKTVGATTGSGNGPRQGFQRKPQDFVPKAIIVLCCNGESALPLGD